MNTVTYKKYPRTPHLPWSRTVGDDDKILPDDSIFLNKNVVITEKMDGENTSIYRDHLHARSIDSRYHPSRAWIANFANTFSYKMPEGWRICGENLYAKHSIKYNSLKSYFYGFSIWNENNKCLSWGETLKYFECFGITAVPILYEGIYDRNIIKRVTSNLDTKKQEGYVIRNRDSFNYDDFKCNVGKYVRKSHVQTDKHWMHSELEINNLENGIE